MPKFYTSIPDELADWAMAQPVFWTATAPTAGKHINVSPKGYASFSVLGPNQAAYFDATGSGAETISHLYENGRITICFASFDDTARIMRFFCRGRVIEYLDAEFPGLAGRMGQLGQERMEGCRAIILLDVWKVQTSCGYGVPIVNGTFTERPTMAKWSRARIEKGDLEDYRMEKNRRSLDGLVGLKAARRDVGEWLVVGEVGAWMRKMAALWDVILVGIVIGLLLAALASRMTRTTSNLAVTAAGSRWRGINLTHGR